MGLLLLLLRHLLLKLRSLLSRLVAIEELVFVGAQIFLSAVACRLGAVIAVLLFLARLGSRCPGLLVAAVAQLPAVAVEAHVEQFPAVAGAADFEQFPAEAVAADVAQFPAVADGQLQELLLQSVVRSHKELEIVEDETQDQVSHPGLAGSHPGLAGSLHCQKTVPGTQTGSVEHLSGFQIHAGSCCFQTGNQTGFQN